MGSWIFQGNPSIFDIDGYLRSAPGAITWRVNQHALQIAVGDIVYLWRSKGRGASEKSSGVIACAEVISPVALMVDEAESKPYWVDQGHTETEQLRVWLKLIRVANKTEELKREWLTQDAILKDMRILRQAAGTNFRLTPSEAERLHNMWSRVGRNWSRAESLAGLWAYVKTLGKEVSRSKGSPVETVSKITGRAMGGVYNKVMNYRAIDPRDARKGMSGAGTEDKALWEEFFDSTTQVLNEQAVQDEFDRLWGECPQNGIFVRNYRDILCKRSIRLRGRKAS